MIFMKKLIAFALTCMILLSNFFIFSIPVNAAKAVILDKYIMEKNDIQLTAGDEFDMYLIIKKNTLTVSNISIGIDGSSSFYLKDSSLDMPLKSGSNATDFHTFVYTGGPNKLRVIITYSLPDGTVESVSDFLTISQANPDAPSAPVDTTKTAPKIVIAGNSSIPSGQAGSQLTYTLPVKNISQYAAKKVVISPILEDSLPIEIESMNLSQTIDSISANETREVKFTFSLSSGAAPKTYPIKFNIQFYNTHNDYYSSTETGYLKITEGSKLPKLALKTVVTNPSPVHPGENFTLDITLENQGAISAKNASVTLLGLKNDGASIIGTTNKQTASYIYGNDISVFSYNLSASKKMEAGANSLKIKIDYTDTSGLNFSDEIEFFYNVQALDAQTVIELQNIVSPSSTLAPGDNALVSFDIANTGTADAGNVKVTVASDKEIIPRTQNTIIIPNLKAGETKNVQFQLFVSDEAVTKNYSVSLNVEYDLPSSGTVIKQTVMQYVGFYVENSSGKSVPRLIIDKYSINPEAIKAGHPFTLELSILNTSKTSAINNIKVTLNSDDGTFTTVNSNSFYIESIPPKKKVQKKVSFSSKSDAAPKQYMISINYEYEDEKGNPYTTKDIVGIPLQQTPRLVIGDLSFPPEAFLGSPIPVNVSFFNMGKSTLYNLLVKLEGDFKVEGTSYFVGNFESGKTDSFDGAVTPQTVGPVKGFIIFTYEDAEGNPQEVKKEISFNAVEMPAPPPMPGEGDMSAAGGKKIPLWAYIAGGVVLLGILITIVLVVRKKIKARKEFMLDEEL